MAENILDINRCSCSVIRVDLRFEIGSTMLSTYQELLNNLMPSVTGVDIHIDFFLYHQVRTSSTYSGSVLRYAASSSRNLMSLGFASARMLLKMFDVGS